MKAGISTGPEAKGRAETGQGRTSVNDERLVEAKEDGRVLRHARPTVVPHFR